MLASVQLKTDNRELQKQLADIQNQINNLKGLNINTHINTNAKQTAAEIKTAKTATDEFANALGSLL